MLSCSTGCVGERVPGRTATPSAPSAERLAVSPRLGRQGVWHPGPRGHRWRYLNSAINSHLMCRILFYFFSSLSFPFLSSNCSTCMFYDWSRVAHTLFDVLCAPLCRMCPGNGSLPARVDSSPNSVSVWQESFGALHRLLDAEPLRSLGSEPAAWCLSQTINDGAAQTHSWWQ